MKLKLFFAVLTIITANIAIGCAAMLYSHAQSGTAIGIGIESAADTVDLFCDSLENGDFAELENMIYGYSALNLAARPESNSANKLLDCLRSSYHCTPVGEVRTTGMTAEQDIIVEYFSVYDAKEQVRKYAQEIYAQRLEAALSYDELFDENDSLLESVALEIYDEALTQIVENKNSFIVSEQITVELVYAESRWQIVLNDNIINILLGDINKF